MPTTYTHDLFGKEVYKRLPKEVRELIFRYGDLYRIGLHGPDILFYYRCLYKNKVNQFGVSMHKERARAFFEQGIRTVRDEGDEALLAYLLGFVNHFILDSEVHPTVERIVDEHGPSHTVQEKELDRTLMLETGKNPYHYYPSDCIVPKFRYAWVIHKAIPLVQADKIYAALRMMKWMTNCMVYDDNGRKQKILLSLLRVIGQREKLGDHFMKEYPPEGVQVYVRELKEHYEEALDKAPAFLEEVYDLARDHDRPVRLSERFDRTYNG
ncbi:MAG: zinc dependent phospholipase C family protein [Eubacteriales bacterium]|nr:zinc dependent phospholipase C family protein [Eubacteriales bacterium]